MELTGPPPAPADSPGRQEVGPDVDRLVGHLEAAEDAVQRRALRVPVPRDDAVLSEHLGEEVGGGSGLVFLLLFFY